MTLDDQNRLHERQTELLRAKGYLAQGGWTMYLATAPMVKAA